MITFFRFIIPFLFVRNWYTGQWEFSRARGIFALLVFLFVLVGVVVLIQLEAPLEYRGQLP